MRQKSLNTYKIEHGIEDSSIINIGQIPEIKEKIKSKVGNKKTNPDFWKEQIKKLQNTCLEKYGVRSFSQTNEFAKKVHYKVTYNGQQFDSKWEVKVAKYCLENGIEFKYQPEISFEYEVNGKKHYYHPDFLINGKLYEIKGDHFLAEDGTWFNPYDKNDTEKQKARQKCCLANNVIVLYSNELKNLEQILNFGSVREEC